MSTDPWPQSPIQPEDYPKLLELLGREEFERRVCPLGVARERLRAKSGDVVLYQTSHVARAMFFSFTDQRP